VILSPTNDDADEIKSIVLSMIPKDEKTYVSCDTLPNSNDGGAFSDMEPSELLHSLKILGLSNHCLEFKVSAPIILLGNLNQSIGLCNDTRLAVTKMGDRVVQAKVISGLKVGEAVLIPQIDLTASNLPDLQVRQRQFPLKLAFTMTINKSQEQTSNQVGVYLPRHVFSYSQLYMSHYYVFQPLPA